MEGDHVALFALVDGLEHVNLAVLGPVAGVGEPERRPGRAAVGCVLDVKDEEALVVCLLGLDAHGETPGRGVGCAAGADGGVDLEDGRVCAGVGEVLQHVSMEASLRVSAGFLLQAAWRRPR